MEDEVRGKAPFVSPWRFVMMGETAGNIFENNYLILNLNAPNKITDTSWIKPGKVIRDLTLTTEGRKAYIDFAVQHNIQYVIESAGWYGNEFTKEADASTVTLDPARSKGSLDMQEVRLADRIKAVLMLAKGFSCQEMREILPLGDDTVRGYGKLYAGHGVRGLLSEGRTGRDPMLSPGQLEELDAHLTETVYPGVGGIIAWVRSRFGLEYSRSGMTALLRRMGFVYKCPKVLPSKGDPEAQRKFVEEYRELEEGLGEDDHIYFWTACTRFTTAWRPTAGSRRGSPSTCPPIRAGTGPT